MSGVDYLQDPAKIAARRWRAAQERVRALQGPDPADPDTYWRALASIETDWSPWINPEQVDLTSDWRQVA